MSVDGRLGKIAEVIAMKLRVGKGDTRHLLRPAPQSGDLLCRGCFDIHR